MISCHLRCARPLRSAPHDYELRHRRAGHRGRRERAGRPAWSAGARAHGGRGPLRRRWARLRADPLRMAAVRDSWRALWSSRLLVWVAGVGTLLAFGFGPVRNAFNPPGVTRGFGWLGDLLAAPAARWDASWYLVIAALRLPPRPRLASPPRAPRSSRCTHSACSAIAWLGAAARARRRAAVAARARARSLRHPPPDDARAGAAPGARGSAAGPARSPAWRCWSRRSRRWRSSSRRSTPSRSTSRCRSGVFWCARQGRWARGRACSAALAGATRSAGVVLALPALILYLYGPREDRRRRPRSRRARSLRPRYRLRRDVAVAGAACRRASAVYMGYLALSGGDALIAVPRPGRLGQALRRALPRRLGRDQGRLRGRAPAAVLPAPPRLLPDRRRQPVRRSPGTT